MKTRREAVEEALDKLLKMIREEYELRNRKASGRFGESLEYKKERKNGWTVYGAYYTPYMIKGRKAGGLPPVEAIKEWILEKEGLPLEFKKFPDKYKWAIAVRIAKEGVRVPNKFYDGKFLEVAFDEWEQKVLPTLMAELGTDISVDIKKTLLEKLKEK